MNIIQLINYDVLLFAVMIALSFFVVLQARKLRRLEFSLTEQSGKLEECKSEITALLQCEKGMGSRLKQQQQQVRNIIERQDKIEVSDGAGTSYRQAMVLLNKGASADELIDACDMSRGELELLSRLNSASSGSTRKPSRLG